MDEINIQDLLLIMVQKFKLISSILKQNLNFWRENSKIVKFLLQIAILMSRDKRSTKSNTKQKRKVILC